MYSCQPALDFHWALDSIILSQLQTSCQTRDNQPGFRQQLVQRQHCSQIINLKTMSVPVNAFVFFAPSITASALLRESKRVGTATRCEFHSLPINVLTNPITYNWLRSKRDTFNGRCWNWSLWPVRGLFWESWIIGWKSGGLYCFLVKNQINPSFFEKRVIYIDTDIYYSTD